MSEDEKKPPVGGVDYALLSARNRARSRLLDARVALDSAVGVAGLAGLRPCAEEIQRFVDTELDAMFSRALTLLEQEPEPTSPRLARIAAAM